MNKDQQESVAKMISL